MIGFIAGKNYDTTIGFLMGFCRDEEDRHIEHFYITIDLLFWFVSVSIGEKDD